MRSILTNRTYQILAAVILFVGLGVFLSSEEDTLTEEVVTTTESSTNIQDNEENADADQEKTIDNSEENTEE